MPILVACLDQGAIGNAGMAFAIQNHMIDVKFEKTHRSIRDYKLATGQCYRSVFLRTQLQPQLQTFWKRGVLPAQAGNGGVISGELP